MFKQRDIVTAVEIGTSKVCVLMGTTDEQGHLLVLAHGERPSANAVVKGEIVNMEQATKIVGQTLEDAEQAAETEIDPRHVYVAVTGNHIVPYRGSGIVPIQGGDRKITREHVDEALRSASLISLAPDQVTMNFIEGDFLLDEARRLQNPLGQIAHKLQAYAHIICGNRNRVENFLFPVKEAGIEYSTTVFSALATAHSVLSDDASKRGVLLLDMGAGTTDFILFHGNGVYDSGVLAVGCEHLANDLALGLDLNIVQARKILVDNVSAHQRPGGAACLEVVGNINRREIPFDTIDKIIDLRLRETFGIVRQRLAARQYLHHVGGVIITGGAALLPHTQPALYTVFEAPVNIMGDDLPGDISGAVTDLKTPRYSMILGLLRYGLKQGVPQRSLVEGLDRGMNLYLKRIWRGVAEAIKF